MGKYQSESTPVSTISESLAPRSTLKKSYNSKNEGQYRSNLSSLFTLFRDIKNFVNEDHHKILMKTPFYHFFCAFLNGKVKIDEIKKSDVELRNLIKRYQPSSQSFLLGQTEVPLRVSDIALIFGIASGDVDVTLAYEQTPDEAFLRRRCLRGAQRSNTFLRLQIIDSVKGNTPTDIEDFVKLVCLYALNTVFLSPSNDKISQRLFSLVEDLDKMKSYAWAASIHKHLMLSIEENRKTPDKVQGCAIVLQYWLCEHTNLIESSGVHRFPRFLKWSLPSSKLVFKTIKYDNISAKQVMESELDATPTEIMHLNVKYTSEDNMMLIVNTPPSIEKINYTSTMPSIEQVIDTITMPSFEQMNYTPTTPSIEQMNDSVTLPSVEPINDTSAMHSTKQINDTSALVHEIEILNLQHESDMKLIEYLTCKHESDMKHIEYLTCIHESEMKHVEYLTCKHKADMKRIEDLACKHKADRKHIEDLTCKQKSDMKRIEDLTGKHKELVAQVQKLNALVASITECYSN